MINMLILGSTYALLGIGLTLIFGIMRVVNFAHGELYAFGAYFVYFIAVMLGFNFFLALLFAIVAGCLLGALIECEVEVHVPIHDESKMGIEPEVMKESSAEQHGTSVPVGASTFQNKSREARWPMGPNEASGL